MGKVDMLIIYDIRKVLFNNSFLIGETRDWYATNAGIWDW